jgi:hypothetical protein
MAPRNPRRRLGAGQHGVNVPSYLQRKRAARMLTHVDSPNPDTGGGTHVAGWSIILGETFSCAHSASQP